MIKSLLYLSISLIPTVCLGQTEIFNYKKALTLNRTLTATINSINRSSGEVEFGGGDSRGPTTPGLTFTWIWGDGTSTNGFFPQKKTYTDVSKNYLAKVVANYSAMEKDTVEILVDFIKGKLSPVALDPKLKVYIPSQSITFDNSHGNFPKIILPPFPDKFFSDLSRTDYEYLMQLGATIEFDFLNENAVLYQGKFEQYMFRDSTFGGAYSLWFTRPVSFGSGDGFIKGADSDFSSLYHEMGHNMTLNFPANFIFGGKIDGQANAIYSETMAQIFQYSVGYEIINNYKAYGLDELFLSKFKTNFFNGIVNLRKNYTDYVQGGMKFTTWNDPTTPHDEALLTFLTTAYKFYEYAEQQNKGYRTPIKRLTKFLSGFNAEWQQRYDQFNNTSTGQAFRATMMVAALSHAFQKDLRADFRTLNFTISDADWTFLNPQVLDISTKELAVGANSSSGTFDITSNVAWTLTSSQSWLTANASSGTGNKTVTLTATANTALSPRTATVTIAANGLDARTVTVTQAGVAPSLTVTTNAVNFNATGSEKPTVGVMANINWTATSSQPWLSVSPATGSGNMTVTLTASANSSVAPRTAQITFAANGTESKSVTVTQAGTTAFVNVSATTLAVAFAEGSNTTFDVASNTAWTVASSQPWLVVAPASSSGNAKVTLTASANPLIDPRKAVVTVRANGAVDKTIEVSQAAAPITGVPTSIGTELLFFPNPVADRLQLYGLPPVSQITLYDIQGKIVKTVPSGISETTLFMNDLAEGTYLIQIQKGAFSVQKRILKLK